MFPDLALKVKNHAANMGSGFVVIVFARWNAVRNSSSFSIATDKPRVESSVEDSGHVALVLPDKSGN
jgi:hypothetical protein